jgi:hypothetical protein
MGIDADAENNFININGMWHATLSVSMGPQQLLTFAQLKARIPRSVPYRIRMDVMPGAEKSVVERHPAHVHGLYPASAPHMGSGRRTEEAQPSRSGLRGNDSSLNLGRDKGRSDTEPHPAD